MNFIEGLLAPDCVVVPLEDLERANGVPMDGETETTFVHLQFTAQAILLHIVGTHRCAETEDTGALKI